MPELIEVGCLVCRGQALDAVCSAAEVRDQFSYLHQFHQRRLRCADNGGAELADRAEFTQGYVTDIVTCRNCGLVFREARPPAATVLAEYQHDSYGEERLASLFDSQLELFRSKAQQLRSYLPSQRQPVIVEVGSFVGGFLAAARELGWNVVGIDPGEEVTAFCRRKDLPVFQTKAADAPIAAGSADCVVIWNTFDQLPDPRPTLAAVQRWLRPNGVLGVRVPNGACFRTMTPALRRLPRALQAPFLAAMAWNNLLAFPYLSGYSTAPLDRLLAGFELHRVGFFPDTLMRLADIHNKPWARYEERLLKRAWRALAYFRPDDAPWFDAYYEKRAGL